MTLLCAVVYSAQIFGLWTIYVTTLYLSVAGVNNIPARIFLNEVIRALIFVAPIFILLKFVIGEKPISYLKLDTNIKIGVLWGIVASVGYAALVFARTLLTTSAGAVNPKTVPTEARFTALTAATLTEEIAFRGFLLQTFLSAMKFRAANSLTALLFVAIHISGWFILGDAPLLPGKIIVMPKILFLGLLLGYLFERANSLWACVILHDANNLLATILFE